jgi:UDP-N-acetylglucosamine 1-carboxyvinyltransferase
MSNTPVTPQKNKAPQLLKKNNLPDAININQFQDTDGLPQDGMDKLVVRGGNRLEGDITISGAKNAALPLMCAAILSADPLTLENVPLSLRDIASLNEVLKSLGVAVAIDEDNNSLHLSADSITSTTAAYNLVRKMRASVLVLGPLLARFKKARVSLPGGCAIGSRPVDLHIKGLEALGAEIKVEEGYIVASAPEGLKGGDIVFPKVSVGATENLMMAAALAKGTTRMINAAQEPEIVDLAECLNKMGAKISGHGTSEITIEGVESLHGATHAVVADRIETGTFMIAAAMTGGKLTLKNASVKQLDSLIDILRKADVQIDIDGADMTVTGHDKPIKGFDIMTEPYPGFPTDLQAQLMAMMTLCEGASMITETVFENRFMHVPELNRMGANITAHSHSAIIRGVDGLKGAPVMATDLRASVALVLAGLVATGETVISRIYHLERGYENIAQKLGGVGADIIKIQAAK